MNNCPIGSESAMRIIFETQRGKKFDSKTKEKNGKMNNFDEYALEANVKRAADALEEIAEILEKIAGKPAENKNDR